MGDAQQQNVSETKASVTSSLTKTRKKSFKIFFIGLLLVFCLAYIWFWLHSGSVETDNAYVGANTAPVTSMINAQVNQVYVNDTEYVHQGDLLVQLDNRDAQIVLAQAEAQLSKAQRQFKQTKANSNALDSQIFVSDDAIQSAKAQLLKSRADYNKAVDDFKRRQQLVSIGGVSKEDLSSAENIVNTTKAALDVAQANLSQAQSSQKTAQSNLAANNALILGVNENDTPDVLIAKANLQQAKLDMERTAIRAPIDGIISSRNVQIGQHVAAGTVIMKIVPIQQLYVDANFKESQLSKVRVGQKAELTSDLYDSNIVYHGHVIGLAGGTGAAFAMIPAQNATGNWIKVVQRLPVRIALDKKELQQHPLRVGLTMDAKIDLNSK